MTPAPASHLHAIGIRDLPEDMVACGSCGIVVPGPATEEHSSIARVLPDGRVEEYAAAHTHLFGTCESCAARKALAAELSHTPGLRRLGHAHIIADRLDAALAVLDATNSTYPTEWTVPVLMATMDRLTNVGKSLMWFSRYSPVRTPEGHVNEAASSPWLFANIDILAEAERCLSEWRIDRLGPRDIPHPGASGCMACGVATSTGRRVSEAWTRVDVGTRHGWLCAADGAIFLDQGAQTMSHTFIDRSIIEMMDPDRAIRRTRPYPPTFKGVALWVDTGRKPNTVRWGHQNLTGAEATLRSGNW